MVEEVSSEADWVLRRVRDGLDSVIPDAFTRKRQAWSRQRDQIDQAIRLERMPNRHAIPWVTFSVRLHVHVVGRSDIAVLTPLLGRLSQSGRSEGRSVRLDGNASEVADQAVQELAEDLPFGLAYLERVRTREAFLSALSPGSLVYLEALVALGRRDDLGDMLATFEFEVDLRYAADRSSAFRVSRAVLDGHALLGVEPDDRWMGYILAALESFQRRPSRADRDAFEYITENLAASY